MNNTFSEYLDKFLLVFIDDILIYSQINGEHEERLQILLWLLQKHQIYAKFSKCDFYKPQIQCLGKIISEKWIFVDPEKIKSIEEWPTPTCVTDIRSFMGIIGYYRKFIDKFSRIACPITCLQKKANKFLWMTKYDNKFQNLKQLLTIARLLQIADRNGDFVFYVDARKEGLSGVLMQIDYAIYYE